MTLVAEWVPKMPAEGNQPKSMTVRVKTDLARMLQTIAALSEQMGQPFKTAAYIDDLLRQPVTELYEKVTKDFVVWRDRQQKPGGRK